MSAALFSDSEARAVYLQLVGSPAAHPADFTKRATVHFESRCSQPAQGTLATQAENLLLLSILKLNAGEFEPALRGLEQCVGLDSRLHKELGGEGGREVYDFMLKYLKVFFKDDSDPELFYWQGRIQNCLGKVALALQSYSAALRSDPNHFRAGLASAAIYQQLGQAEQSLQILQKIYEAQPESALVCTQIGLFYLSQNATAQALRFLEKSSNLEPNNADTLNALAEIYLRQGRHEVALTKYQKALQQDRTNSRALVGMAECCRELYRFEEAISYYQNAIKVNPVDVKALASHGSLCVQLGGLDLGIESLTKAVELNPVDVDICSNLAKAYQQKGDTQTAAHFYAKTVELNPKDYFASYNLGLIFRSQGKLEKASEAFSLATELRPNDSQYQYQHARSLLELSKPRQALEAARRAASLNPHNKEIQLIFARASLSNNMPDQALHAASVALQLDPSNLEATLYQAQAYLELDRVDQAEANYQHALKLSPSHSHGLRGLGRVYLKQGHNQRALECLQQSLEADPDDKGAVNDLGLIYQNLDQLERVFDSVDAVLRRRQNEPRLAGVFLENWLAFLSEKQAFDIGAGLLETFTDRFPGHRNVAKAQSEWHFKFAQNFLDSGRVDLYRSALERLLKSQPQQAQAKEWLARDIGQSPQVTGTAASSEFHPPTGSERDYQVTDGSFSTSPSKAVSDSTRFFPGALGEDLLLSEPTASPPPRSDSSVKRPITDSGSWDFLSDEDMLPPKTASSSGSFEAVPAPKLRANDSNETEAVAEPVPVTQAAFETKSEVRSTPLQPLQMENRPAEPPDPDVSPVSDFDGEARQFILNLPDLPNANQDTGHLQEMSLKFAAQLSSAGWLKEAALVLSDPYLFPSADDAHHSLLQDVVAEMVKAYRQLGQLGHAQRLLEYSGIADPQQPADTNSGSGEFDSAELSMPVSWSGRTDVASTQNLAQEESSDGTLTEYSAWQSSEPVTGFGPFSPQAAEGESVSVGEASLTLTGNEDRDALTSLIKKYPDRRDIREALYDSLGEDLASLVKIFRDLVQEQPDEAYHVINLGRAFVYSGSDSMAILQFRKYVKLEATAEGYTELGETYLRMGKTELGQQAIARAAELQALEDAED